jgi:hypothetical protein
VEDDEKTISYYPPGYQDRIATHIVAGVASVRWGIPPIRQRHKKCKQRPFLSATALTNLAIATGNAAYEVDTAMPEKSLNKINVRAHYARSMPISGQAATLLSATALFKYVEWRSVRQNMLVFPEAALENDFFPSGDDSFMT